jgi:pseudouridine synthase
VEKKVYVLLNKPRGVTSTVADRHAARTVVDLVKVPERLFPVGRLDKDSEGLMLLTNDGTLMQRLTHPSYEVRKTYEVVTAKPLTEKEMAELRAGIVVEGRKAKPDAVESISPTAIRITIHEGRKHIIRVMMARLGHTVLRLTRMTIGPLNLRGIKPGQWRHMTKEELASLG